MKILPCLVCFLVVLHCSYAPPVTADKSKGADSEVKDDLEEFMEYHRYLKEVVQALESDPDFRERLEKANDEDVRSGKIAEQLDFVNHNVRTRLDEIKRRELERLRHLATKQFELSNNIDTEMPKFSNDHLDHGNPHTFEIEDLKKLIKKTTADLEEADKQRKQEFKEYEMQKEFEKHQQLESLDEEKKKELEKKMEEEEKAKKHHKPLHHPVTREQLLELWKKADNLDSKDFNPKVFFMMHDVDGNGVWDADEVKALFIKELDKMYGPGGPNKDLHERAEEMERMREHVFKEADKNRDGLIDFNEFMMETKKSEFNQDQGWQPIDENQIYTQAEYQEFERRRMEEIKYLQQRGLVDAHGRPIPGAEHQIHQVYQQQQAYQQQHHGQVPQYQGQVPAQYPQGQQPQYYQQGAPGQVPQGYQQQPQGYQQATGQVYQQASGQGYQQAQGQGYQQAQGQGYQAPVQGYQQAPGQAYQQPPGQAYQQAPAQQGQQQPNVNQGQAPPAQQPAPVAAQGQAPPQNIPQGQPQASQGQAPPQVQAPSQGQAPQGQVLSQGQAPQGQVSQDQVPPPGQAPKQA